MGIAGVFDQIGTPIDINVKAKTADNNGAEKEEPRRSPPSSKVEAGAYFNILYNITYNLNQVYSEHF